MFFSSCILHFFLQEVGIIKVYLIYVCRSLSRHIFLTILYGYKLVLQVVILAFTSLKVKVKVKGLNDGKYIAAATSVTSVVLVVILFATYTLESYANVFPALFCTGLFIGTTSILGLVFVPKVRWLVSAHVSFKICAFMHSPLLKPQYTNSCSHFSVLQMTQSWAGRTLRLVTTCCLKTLNQ